MPRLPRYVLPIIYVAALLAGCGDDHTDHDAHDDNALDAPQCLAGSPTAVAPETITRTNEALSTEFSILFLSLQCDEVPDELRFRVDLTNHTGNIVGFDHDLDRIARLVTDTGKTLSEGLSYEILSADEHHPSGVLRAPQMAGGEPFVDCGVGRLTLELPGMAGEAEEALNFDWDADVLDVLRSCS